MEILKRIICVSVADKILNRGKAAFMTIIDYPTKTVTSKLYSKCNQLTIRNFLTLRNFS